MMFVVDVGKKWNERRIAGERRRRWRGGDGYEEGL